MMGRFNLAQIREPQGLPMNNDQPRAHALAIEGMTCAHCEVAVERVLRAQAGVTRADVRYEQGRAIVNADALDLTALNAALSDEGYSARNVELVPGFLAPKASGVGRAL